MYLTDITLECVQAGSSVSVRIVCQMFNVVAALAVRITLPIMYQYQSLYAVQVESKICTNYITRDHSNLQNPHKKPQKRQKIITSE